VEPSTSLTSVKPIAEGFSKKQSIHFPFGRECPYKNLKMNIPFVKDPNSIRKGPCTFVKFLKVDKFFTQDQEYHVGYKGLV
jgi:hypothetical protein